MTVITRFAPSPTGYLHIGSARTALFNWLFARHMGGKYLLRIEDTDRERSTEGAVKAIIEGLNWLGLFPDEPPIFQFARADHHADMALQLLREEKAYYCYCTPKELEERRERAKAEGLHQKYDGRCRNLDPQNAPIGIKPVIRIKAPLVGETVLEDKVQGRIVVLNEQLDDMVLLRADGTPTYMLSVVVDDYDMNVTHVIRGDDHLTNTFRQLQLYTAFGWEPPLFAHIPLIHGPDGAKLSKRHGALGVEAYRDMGILPETLCNYLLRLGWGHGDVDIISIEEAIKLFSLEGIGKSASRLDMAKLFHLNSNYIQKRSSDSLMPFIIEYYHAKGRHLLPHEVLRIGKGMEGLKKRAQTTIELAEGAEIYCDIRPIQLHEIEQVKNVQENTPILKELYPILMNIEKWDQQEIEHCLKKFIDAKGVKLGKIGPFIRLVLTGKNNTPGIFEIMNALGKEETLVRIKDFL